MSLFVKYLKNIVNISFNNFFERKAPSMLYCFHFCKEWGTEFNLADLDAKSALCFLPIWAQRVRRLSHYSVSSVVADENARKSVGKMKPLLLCCHQAWREDKKTEIECESLRAS